MTRRKPTPSPKAVRLIERFGMWSAELSWAGSRPPEEGPLIQRAYDRALTDLGAYIESLENRKPTVASDIMPGDTK